MKVKKREFENFVFKFSLKNKITGDYKNRFRRLCHKKFNNYEQGESHDRNPAKSQIWQAAISL